MPVYADWQKLEKIMEADDSFLKEVAKLQTDLTLKWTVLRKRLGKNCPTAKSCLKVICMYEANNDLFIRSVNEGKWLGK